MEECLTLILNEDRIEVNKRKLASKSYYFSSLFSHNFNDSLSKEYFINYDVALCTLQNFVEWIHDENRVDVYYHSIKVSMEKFVQDNFMELLNLLQLSILFMVDELTNDIVDIIILFWLLPKKVIDIWLLAQELNIKGLRDVCLSVCLDRFEKLPVHLLAELTEDNITRLIGNNNVRSSTSFLHFVRNQWMKLHTASNIVDIKGKGQPKFIKGTVVYVREETGSKIPYLYTWDGNALCKNVQLKNLQYPGKCLIGMQVVGRGFSVYTVGGEVGFGSGHFNEVISRYCLLSKKWYYQAKLPVPRRHMIVVFLKHKLIIVGGVGRHRLKLRTVDILDIHTGNWTKGGKVPVTFTNVPPHCVSNGKLFLLKSSVYIYCPVANCWRTISIYDNPIVQRVDAFLTCGTTLFLMGDSLDVTIFSRIDVTRDSSVCEREDCSKRYVDHDVITDATIVYEDDLYQLRYVHVADVGVMMLNVDRCDEPQYLHLHSEIKKDFQHYVVSKSNCFNIIDPDTL